MQVSISSSSSLNSNTFNQLLWSVSRKIIPYFRVKLHDVYTPLQTKLLEEDTLHTYIAHIWQ